MKQVDIPLTVLITDEAVVAEAEAVDSTGAGLDVSATGTAKKHPKDKPNSQIGYNLAVARALVALAGVYAQKAADLGQFPVDLDELHVEPTFRPGKFATDLFQYARGGIVTAPFVGPQSWNITLA